jgi:ribose/xylose/arabinose/galactoside ABC-type transport system permease subunit
MTAEPSGQLAEDGADALQLGRDRFAAHVVWEVVLLLAAGGLTALVYRAAPVLFAGAPLGSLLLQTAAALLLATAFAASLRAGAANLAVGTVLAATGAGYAWFAASPSWDPVESGLVAVGVAVVVGLLIGVTVVMLRAPGWAVSLAAGAVLAIMVPVVVGPEARPVHGISLLPWAWWVFGAAVAISVTAGLLSIESGIRGGVGRYRPDGDPAAWRPGGAMVIAALCGSCLLAGAAGMVTALRTGVAVPPDAASGGLGPAGGSLTLTAVAAALLGGTSVHGRRGGVAGTVLAVIGLQMLVLLMRLDGASAWAVQLVPPAGVLAGLAVSLVVELRGRPAAQPLEEPPGGTPPGGTSRDSIAWAEELLRRPGPEELVRRRGDLNP